ncbi:hypothetical protein SMNI109538_12605 [Smaragdicoccus niigatensis]
MWDINLRANLRLWPEPLPNVRSLAAAIGSPWDETQIATEYFGAEPGEDRRRAVRQTYEAMAYEGLVHRTSEGILEATRLGDFVLRFLGLTGDRTFICDANRAIAAGPMIYGLSIITEVRVIWSLMRMLDNRLSNEELNRAMARIHSTADVTATAASIRSTRESGDVADIGPRLYDDAGYGTGNESDQRKAMNPHFLLAGGGGLFISVDAGERRLHPSVLRQIDGALRSSPRQIHAGTESQIIQAIARASMAPRHYMKDAS